MGLLYSIPYPDAGLARSGATDLWEVVFPSDAAIILHEIVLTQLSDADPASDSEMLRVTISRYTGSPTSGSGGTSVGPVPLISGAPAAGSTAEIGNTAQISGGTQARLYTDAFNVLSGWHYLPTPELRFEFAPSTVLVVDIPAPGDSLTFTGYLVYEEVGG